jgi:hypothetical protein
VGTIVLFLIGCASISLAAGFTTIWTRWIAVAMAALLAVVFVVAAGGMVAWHVMPHPSCAADQLCQGDPTPSFLAALLIWIFFLLVIVLLGVRTAELVREA